MVRRWRFVAAMILTLGALPAHAQKPGTGPAPIRVGAVEEVSAPGSLTVVGDVEPIRRSIVSSKEASSVAEFPFREGDYVEEGAVLAQLETDLLEHQLAEAVAMVEASKAKLEELENGTRPEEVAVAEALYSGALARQRLANLRRERAERLSKGNAASVEELDQAMMASETAAFEVAQFKAGLDQAHNGPRKEEIEQARATLRSHEAVAERLRRQIKRHQVKAPFAGYIALEHTEVGEWVNEGDPVVDILDLSEVDVVLPVAGRYVDSIALGMEVRIDIESMTDQLLVGRVKAIIPEADRRSRLVPVKVRVANVFRDRQPLLKAGMIARGHFAVGDQEPVLQVSKDAIVLGTGPSLVYRVIAGKDGQPATVQPVPVMLGAARGEKVQIRGELNPGDTVVTQGNERLRPGQQVAIVGEEKKG